MHVSEKTCIFFHDLNEAKLSIRAETFIFPDDSAYMLRRASVTDPSRTFLLGLSKYACQIGLSFSFCRGIWSPNRLKLHNVITALLESDT
uniref:Uncharacterized protein n=1 Tax=Timema poppense TaxID=170557 RepID=A0A7R9GW13_TIMPO|nr:unnamed protein product [Timema poppensis]